MKVAGGHLYCSYSSYSSQFALVRLPLSAKVVCGRIRHTCYYYYYYYCVKLSLFGFFSDLQRFCSNLFIRQAVVYIYAIKLYGDVTIASAATLQTKRLSYSTAMQSWGLTCLSHASYSGDVLRRHQGGRWTVVQLEIRCHEKNNSTQVRV